MTTTIIATTQMDGKSSASLVASLLLDPKIQTDKRVEFGDFDNLSACMFIFFL